jgi:glycosyltransferase involved in cell wall biosynthesis
MSAEVIKEAPRLGVMVIGRPYDLSAATYDGFVTRHIHLVRAVCERHDVKVALLRQPEDTATVADELHSRVVSDERIPRLPADRSHRLRRTFAIIKGREPWARHVTRTVAAIGENDPDVIITLGPWLNDEYAAIFGRWPAIHLFEEDLTRMHELASQSLQGRVFRSFEIWGRGRARSQPRAVVVIGEGELVAARRRFPRAVSLCLPYTLPSADWPLAMSPSSGPVVLVVGTLTQERHAEGLAPILADLAVSRPPELRVRLVSGRGLHSSLEPYLELPWVEKREVEGELWREYRAARLALVPAPRATGVKTTILQAWASGCPVVAYAGSAATVARFKEALLEGSEAGAVARQIVRAWEQTDLRAELVRRALAVMATEFDEARVRARFLELVATVASGVAPHAG